MATIILKINAIWKWLSSLFVDQFDKLWALLTDLCCWILESALDIVVMAANALDVSQLEGYANSFGDMPGEIVNIMQLAGLGTASQIVIAAIGIRLLLQIIPFTRLGS